MSARLSASSVLRSLRNSNLSPRLLSSPSQGYVYQIHNLLSPSASAALYEFLAYRFDGWKTEIDAFGPQQRATAYFGDVGTIFSYVGLTLQPRPWPNEMDEARKAANLVAKAHGAVAATACLANHYGEQRNSIPWHSDEVRAHGDSKLVLSLSLGGTRRMCIRPKGSAGQVMSLHMPAGSAVVLAGDAQEYWEHSLPLDSDNAPRRVSLTFRTIVPWLEQGRPPPSGTP